MEVLRNLRLPGILLMFLKPEGGRLFGDNLEILVSASAEGKKGQQV
jgi:hypothetical protein